MEYNYHDSETLLQEKQLKIEKLLQKLASTTNQYMTLEKGEELNNIIKEISDEKTELEEEYFKKRAILLQIQMQLDEATVRADTSQDLLNEFQKSRPDQLQ